MKLDKDTMVKHQFWIGLGSFLFLWFIAVLWLKVAAGEPIEKAQKEYEGKASAVKSAQTNPVNVTTFLPPWNEAAKKFNDHKSVIWGDAWEFQKGMYDWPEEWWTTKDMTTPQTMLTDEERFQYKDKYYGRQIDALRKNGPAWVAPVELAGGFDQVFQPQKWQPVTPTREEIWLAQEDFWVKRELLVDIWKTMSLLAAMPRDPNFDGQKDKPEGVEARYRFANQSWEITLNLRKNKENQLVIGGDSTIKNTDPNHRPQPLTNAKGEGIWFNIAQEQIRTRFEVRGEPVGPNETRPFSLSKDGERKDYDPLDSIVWDQIDKSPIYLSQAFDVTNSPIRRLNAIALAKQDCRTYTWLLQPNQELAQLDAAAEDSEPTKRGGGPPGPGGPGGMPGGMPAPGGMSAPAGPSGMPGMPGASRVPEGNLTPNNSIERNRYLLPPSQDKKGSAPNPPSRHLPVALKLIVEQSHMHDVLLALANSRLRVQISQVEYQHNKDYEPPVDDSKKEGNDVAAGTRVFGGGYMPGYMPMYGMQGRMSPGPGGMMPGSMGMSPGGPRGSAGMSPGGPRGMPGMGMMGGSSMMSPPMMGSTGRGGKSRFTMAPGMQRMPGFPSGPGGTDAKSATSNPHDDNLVDLTIYGIATLYRHPDQPKTSEQPGQPAPPPGGAKPTAAPPSGSPPPPAPPAGKK